MDPTLPPILPPIEEPKPPPPPPEPEAADLAMEAEDEFNDHAIRISQYQEMNGWLRGDRIGQFERDSEAIESGEVEVFRLTDLTNEHEGIVNFHAGMDVTIDLVARDPNDRDEAQALEDYCALVFDEWQDQHLLEGGMPLERTLPDFASRYAMLATYVALDPSNTSTGMYLRTVSGVRVYPVFESARGLTKLFLIYDARADQIIGAHENPLDPKNKVRDKVEALTGDNPRVASHVIEYYDEHRKIVMVEDTVVLSQAHGYGVCPWVVTPAGYGGDPTDLAPNKFMPIDRDDIIRGTVLGNDRSLDIARAYQPFLWPRVDAHAQEEAVAGRFMTLIRRLTSDKPPVVVKQGMLSATEGDPEVSATEGAVTKLRDDDAMDAFPLGVSSDVLQPFLQFASMNRQTGMAAGLALGAQNPASQMSGTALELGRQGGYEKWSPITTCIERHLAAVFRRCLDLVADKGDGLGVDGSYGMLLVPRRAPNARSGLGAMHEITADLVKRTSVRVKVKLGRFNPISLSQTGNGVTIWRSQNLMSKDTAIRIGGFTTDVEGELARIDEDQLNDVPEVKQALTLDQLTTKAKRAEADGDLETARRLYLQAQYVGSEMQLAFFSKLQQLGVMGQPGQQPMDDGSGGGDQPPPGVAPNPQPAPLPDIQGQGQSMPQFGIATGQEGGRPPMLNGGGGANG